MFSFLRVFASTTTSLLVLDSERAPPASVKKNGIANEPAHHSLKMGEASIVPDHVRPILCEKLNQQDSMLL
jgi:hypothetical protein